MTYPPPPGGYDPQQYHVSSQPPQQPSDPYAQGYNAPPPPNYGPGPGQYQQQPNMTPPIGVQPGYPPGAPSALPPQVPPPQQGGNLGIVLGVIVGLVVLLGVAAILIVPGMLEDDDSATAAEETTSAAEEQQPSEDEPSADEEESPAADEESGSGDFAAWGTPVNSDDFEENSPEGVAIRWEVAVDDGDVETLAALMCSSPSSDLQWEYDYEVESGQAWNYDFLIWAIAKEPANGEVEVWAGWTWDDTAPKSQEDLDSGGGNYFTAVEEDGTWKVCDFSY